MSPYKAFLNNVRQYFNTNGFFRFLLSGYIFIFALGGLFFALGAFLGGFFNDFLSCIGIVLMLAGLLLTIIREDMMALVITSASIALLSLVAWILQLAGVIGGVSIMGYYAAASHFSFTTLFYFLVFTTIAIVVFIRAEKFRTMRAASAQARAQMAGISCPRCGAFVPMNAAFCPACGVPNPAMQQYGAVPQVPPQYGPVGAQAPPVQEAAPTPKCVNCGSDIPVGAAFCAKCGAKQQ